MISSDEFFSDEELPILPIRETSEVNSESLFYNRFSLFIIV